MYKIYMQYNSPRTVGSQTISANGKKFWKRWKNDLSSAFVSGRTLG